jgi:hypothetical protein
MNNLAGYFHPLEGVEPGIELHQFTGPDFVSSKQIGGRLRVNGNGRRPNAKNGMVQNNATSFLCSNPQKNSPAREGSR